MPVDGRQHEKAPIPITGCWLRRRGELLDVLVEIDGVWRVVIHEVGAEGPISHIVEPSGMARAPVDDL